MRFTIITFLFMLSKQAEAQAITPPVPILQPAVFSPADIPESEINLPVQIDLKPFFELANKKVDTLFSSPNFPNAWVQDDCSTRYKYSFRRGPLRFDFQKTMLTIGFTGYYKIIGSTRACVNGKALSPWTPECKCGFEEGERRVNVSFTITPVVLVNYIIKMQVVRNEPVPLDKCSVCFWGQDITSSIMQALKKELDLSKADLEKNYGRTDLRPRMQQIWHQLNTPYSVNNMGWLQINPQKVRINRLYGQHDKLYLNIGLAAKPVIRFEKPVNPLTKVPDISSFSRNSGFNINLDAVLGYDSLSAILNRQIAGKEFTFTKAFIRKKFVFEECTLMGSESDRLIIRVKFSGTDNGYFYVTGKPVYKNTSQTLAIGEVNFDVQSKDALLKAADWLFSKKITAAIEKMAQYPVGGFIADAKNKLTPMLNRQWMKGMQSSATIRDISITQILPKTGWLQIRANATGDMAFDISPAGFSF